VSKWEVKLDNKTVAVQSFAEASVAWVAYRDEAVYELNQRVRQIDEDASNDPRILDTLEFLSRLQEGAPIIEDGKEIAHVSFDGCVWLPDGTQVKGVQAPGGSRTVWRKVE
jgi:hypothetical protein